MLFRRSRVPRSHRLRTRSLPRGRRRPLPSQGRTTSDPTTSDPGTSPARHRHPECRRTPPRRRSCRPPRRLPSPLPRGPPSRGCHRLRSPAITLRRTRVRLRWAPVPPPPFPGSRCSTDTGRRLHEKILHGNRAVSGKSGVAGVKAAMQLAGYHGGDPRRPLAPLTDEQRQAMRSRLEELGFLE